MCIRDRCYACLSTHLRLTVRLSHFAGVIGRTTVGVKTTESRRSIVTTAATPVTAQDRQPAEEEKTTGKVLAFIAAFVALAAVLLIPIAGLAMPAKIALGMLASAVIMWVTEAVSYPVSAVMIVGLIAIMLTFATDPETGEAVGASKGLSVAMSGFSSSAVALVAAALALATAMQATGLHRRLALYVLKFAGEKVSNIVIGAIVISIILAFFVPSATARAGGCLSLIHI